MLEFESATSMKNGGGARNTLARPCDTCRLAASSVYCRAHLAYLCSSCDARIHSATEQHERVWVCLSCETSPAVFLCKADSASLCATCDAEIHSANPLARRHHRVPIQTIPGSLYSPLDADPGGLMVNAADDFFTEEADDEDEAASWLLPDPMKNDDDEIRAAVFAGGMDECLDLDENNQFNEGYNNQKQQYGVAQSIYGGDSIVPMQFQKGKNELGSETGYTYPASISQTVSMDVGVVPKSASSMMSHARPSKGTIDLFTSPPIQMSSQLTPLDREARVLRYREKKKTRKFEKTIRYASRKAYAETRPRIKGRFAKRKGADIKVDHMFSSESLMADTSYGVVPSF